MSKRTFTITHTIELNGKLVEDDDLFHLIGAIADDLARCIHTNRVADVLDAFRLAEMEEVGEEPDMNISTDWEET